MYVNLRYTSCVYSSEAIEGALPLAVKPANITYIIMDFLVLLFGN